MDQSNSILRYLKRNHPEKGEENNTSGSGIGSNINENPSQSNGGGHPYFKNLDPPLSMKARGGLMMMMMMHGIYTATNDFKNFKKKLSVLRECIWAPSDFCEQVQLECRNATAKRKRPMEAD